MSKAEGKKIGIKFTSPLVGDVAGSKNAFTITGQEYLYTDGPDNNGDLINKNYSIQDLWVEDETGPQDKILIEFIDWFRNVQGNLTITYDQSLGTLAGTGGAVTSFNEIFTPTDLTEQPDAVGTRENIQASVSGSINLLFIEKIPTYNTEYISASVGGAVTLVNIGDINP